VVERVELDVGDAEPFGEASRERRLSGAGRTDYRDPSI
jgi:hypothetical protein